MSWVLMKRDYRREVEKANAHKTAFLFKENPLYALTVSPSTTISREIGMCGLF